MNFSKPKILTAIWFFALFLNVFSVALFAEPPNIPADKVYCPLTKRLQPVKVSNKEVPQNPQNPLGEICADEKEKKLFADELFRQNLLKINALDEDKFENLVFDYFQKGSAAFADFSQSPDSPHKNSVKNLSVSIAFSKTDETRFVWKTSAEKKSFAQNSRPPNSLTISLFEPQTFIKLEKISRRISPRAPPFSL